MSLFAANKVAEVSTRWLRRNTPISPDKLKELTGEIVDSPSQPGRPILRPVIDGSPTISHLFATTTTHVIEGVYNVTLDTTVTAEGVDGVTVRVTQVVSSSSVEIEVSSLSSTDVGKFALRFANDGSDCQKTIELVVFQIVYTQPGPWYGRESFEVFSEAETLDNDQWFGWDGNSLSGRHAGTRAAAVGIPGEAGKTTKIRWRAQQSSPTWGIYLYAEEPTVHAAGTGEKIAQSVVFTESFRLQDGVGGVYHTDYAHLSPGDLLELTITDTEISVHHNGNHVGTGARLDSRPVRSMDILLVGSEAGGATMSDFQYTVY